MHRYFQSIANTNSHASSLMDAPIVRVDDKHLPLYRVVWIADLPHFCGEDDCEREGQYEIRLDVDDSIWTNHAGRDKVLAALTAWCGEPGPEEGPNWE